MAVDWIKEWAIVISAGATFILALAAFWAIWQNYSFRKEDKEFRLKTAALDDIHQWIMDVKITTQHYLAAAISGDKAQKYIVRSQCNDLLIRTGDMIIAAKIVGVDLEKISQFQESADAYHETLSKIKPGEKISIRKPGTNYYDALAAALAAVGTRRIDLLSKFFQKKERVNKGKKLQKLINLCRSFFLRKLLRKQDKSRQTATKPRQRQLRR